MTLDKTEKMFTANIRSSFQIRETCRSRQFIEFSCKAEVVDLSQKVASNDFQGLKDFSFRATNLVIVGGGNGNAGGSTPDGSVIRIGLGMLAGAIAGDTSIGDRGGL